MDRIERIYKIEQMLSQRRSTPRDDILEALGVSLATFKRDLEYMRDRFNAPIKWDPELRGYRYEDAVQVGPKFQLPGLWFSEQELHALATLQYLLGSIDKGGPIGKQLEPLMGRLNSIIGHDDNSTAEIKKRVKLVSTSARKNDLAHFKHVGSALVKRLRLNMLYGTRHNAKPTSGADKTDAEQQSTENNSAGNQSAGERIVSPQRLIHYRDNWYLGAWCHRANDIRTFSLDAIIECSVLETPAKKIAESTLAKYYDGGYGIFGGTGQSWAVLHFNPSSARYVAVEQWHPEQKGKFLRNGYYQLKVPFSNATELTMDIMRHGPDVEVQAPASLRKAVAARVAETLAVYQ